MRSPTLSSGWPGDSSARLVALGTWHSLDVLHAIALARAPEQRQARARGSHYKASLQEARPRHRPAELAVACGVTFRNQPHARLPSLFHCFFDSDFTGSSNALPSIH